MGIIYKELVRNKKVPYNKGVMLLSLTILTINLMVNSVHYSDKYDIQLETLMFADGIIGIVVLKIIFNLVYTHRICYTYKILDKELIIEKMLGGNKKVVLSINTRDIKLLAPASEVKGIKGIDKTFKFLCVPSKINEYCCVVYDNEKKIRFFFQPSDELVRKLKFVMANR